MPPRFDFAGSQNVKAVDVLWPAPRHIRSRTTVIGYAGNVILPLTVEAAQSGEAGRRLKLDYAVCELCVPAEGKAELVLDGGAARRGRRAGRGGHGAENFARQARRSRSKRCGATTAPGAARRRRHRRAAGTESPCSRKDRRRTGLPFRRDRARRPACNASPSISTARRRAKYEGAPSR
jgi:hypothetical protein